MAIQRWDPVRDLLHLQERLNQLFEEVLARSGAAQEPQSATGSAFKPPIDLCEEGGRYVLRIDLPGVAPEDVRVDVDDAGLSVRGERRPDASVPREAYLRAERPTGRFHVQLALPPSVDRGKVGARHREGVLEITLPKKDEGPDRVRIGVQG